MILAFETEAERQLAVIDAEIRAHRLELEVMGGTPAVSYEHAKRRVQLAQRIRFNLDWLLPMRAEMAAEVGQ